MTTYKQVIKQIEEMDNDDENLKRLEKASGYCSNYELCNGYKHALINEITDQYENHGNEQPKDDMQKLSDVLNGIKK